MLYHCFDFWIKPPPDAQPLPSVVLLLGNDGFLRGEMQTQLCRRAAVEPAEVRIFDGQECAWQEVVDELATLSLFEPDARRSAIVKAGDRLVKLAKERLEAWFASPPTSSLLILHLDSLASNTRLYKAIDQGGWIIGCSPPTQGKSIDLGRVKDWLQFRAKERYGLKLKKPQLSLILEAVGAECGLLDQELAKLALFAEPSGELTDPVIRQHVGSWLIHTTWEIADALVDGRVADALEQLQRTFSSGEHPAAVLPQIAWSLRRYGTAAQLMLQQRRQGRSPSVESIAKEAGFWGADLALAPRRLQRIGMARAAKILRWLLELDLKIKGSHSQTDRAIFAIEEFCLRFA